MKAATNNFDCIIDLLLGTSKAKMNSKQPWRSLRAPLKWTGLLFIDCRLQSSILFFLNPLKWTPFQFPATSGDDWSKIFISYSANILGHINTRKFRIKIDVESVVKFRVYLELQLRSLVEFINTVILFYFLLSLVKRVINILNYCSKNLHRKVRFWQNTAIYKLISGIINLIYYTHFGLWFCILYIQFFNTF